TIDNLISKAKEYHQINSREAKLLAGDFAIQALNKIVVEKASINVSELEPVLRDFEEHAYDESEVVKNLISFLSKNPDINKRNIATLEEELENVNNMNERTELSVRFPRHQPGYDLIQPIHKASFFISGLILESEKGSERFSENEIEALKRINDLMTNRAAAFFNLVHSRISARKEKIYDIALPTMSVSEAAEWRRVLYEIVSNMKDGNIENILDKDGPLLRTYRELWFLADYTLLPLVEGKPRVMLPKHCNLRQIAERALQGIHLDMGRDLPDDTIVMEFNGEVKDFGITADPTMIRETFKILMQNSIQVAIERLEDENEQRSISGLGLFTLKDKPIHLKVSLTKEENGLLSLQVVEMSDDVGGISDPAMLSETRPGNGRQKATELNTSRRKKDTGFGLAYVWHIANIHGGTFWIRNIGDTPGKGIIASMRIPMILPQNRGTVSQDALASNNFLTKGEICSYFGLDYKEEARKQGPLWLWLRKARLSVREETTLGVILADTLSQEDNMQTAIKALGVVVDESRFLRDKYSVGSEEYNKEMKKLLVEGLRLLTQSIYAESDTKIKNYTSRQAAFLAERLIRRFIEENYWVENDKGRLNPCVGDYYINTSKVSLEAMIHDFLNWFLEDIDARPFMRRVYTRRAVLALGVAGAVTTAGYTAYQMFEPSKRTIERLNRLKEMPVTGKFSDDSQAQYAYEAKYLAFLQRNNKNRLELYDYEWLKDFLNKNPERRSVIMFAARVFGIEPELLAGFVLEEEFNRETKNRIKDFIRELLAKDASIHRDMDYKGTVGLGQVKTSHALNRGFLDMLYINREGLKPMLSTESQELFENFLDFYKDIFGSKQSKESIGFELDSNKATIINLVRQDEINILLAAFVIMHDIPDKIVESNKTDTSVESSLPDMLILLGPSGNWLLSKSEYKEIPNEALRKRYGVPFGGVNYYHPLMRYFAVAQRYTGASPANYKRGLVKVKLYKMFLESGLFKGAPDVRPDLPSRDIMAGV
ncbi:MAG: hypothetical protein Q8N76_04715, partial [Candidatus Omnitrophota bacterium]|nr:hypothetical protein [Candidatus Omnitrophota bacterium]